LIGAYALTEPHSGSDALSAKTTARLTPEGTGEKFTAFIVERGMGVQSGPDANLDGLFSAPETERLGFDVIGSGWKNRCRLIATVSRDDLPHLSGVTVNDEHLCARDVGG